MAIFVLVHGAGHGGWCYQRVAARLRAAGHDVFTPTLTGLGERAHLLSDRVDLEMHITDVVAVLEFEDLHGVVLAGHSYGGPVITGVADRLPERIGKLVYLDASYPANGESVADEFGATVDALRAAGTVQDGIELILLPTPVGGPFYGVTDPDDRAWMAGRLTAFPWKCFAQPLRLANEAAVATIPTFHIACTASVPGRHPDMMERARADGRLWTIDTAHDLMITEPAFVADRLLEIATRDTERGTSRP